MNSSIMKQWLLFYSRFLSQNEYMEPSEISYYRSIFYAGAIAAFNVTAEIIVSSIHPSEKAKRFNQLKDELKKEISKEANRDA